MKEVIQISPSLLNSYAAMVNKLPYMDEFRFKSQTLGLEPMSEAALSGNAIHHACWGGGEDLPEVGNWIVDPEIPIAVNEIVGFKKGCGAVPEVPFMYHFPEYRAKLSGRCDLLWDDHTTEGKTSSGVRGAAPELEHYTVLPQTQAYASFFNVPCEVVVIHIKRTKPRNRPKGTIGLLSLASPRSIQKGIVYPSRETKENLDKWVRAAVDYVSKDEEMLLHLLKKGRKEQKGF